MGRFQETKHTKWNETNKNVCKLISSVFLIFFFLNFYDLK